MRALGLNVELLNSEEALLEEEMTEEERKVLPPAAE
jgi:hypothetical protein